MPTTFPLVTRRPFAGTPQAQLVTPQNAKAIKGYDGRSHRANGTRAFAIAGSDIFDPRFVRPGSPPPHRRKGYLRKLIENDRVARYLEQYQPELFIEFRR